MEYPDYPFAKFNHKVEAWPEYTEEEYTKHIAGLHTNASGGPWTRKETDRLFALCKQFDVRWNVIADRFAITAAEAVARVHGFPPPAVQRTQRPLYTLKERFYGILQTLHSARGQQEEAARWTYDAAHEERRTRQLHSAFIRPQADEEEEKRLEAELKQIHLQLHRLEKAAKLKRRQEWRATGATGCPPMLPLNGTPSEGFEGPALLLPPLHLHKRNYVRSDCLQLRSSASGPGPRLIKKMALVIAELAVPSQLMPTEAVSAAYDKLRQSVLKVLALQKHVTRLQAEMQNGGGRTEQVHRAPEARGGKSIDLTDKGQRQKRKAHGRNDDTLNKRNRVAR